MKFFFKYGGYFFVCLFQGVVPSMLIYTLQNVLRNRHTEMAAELGKYDLQQGYSIVLRAKRGRGQFKDRCLRAK